MSNSICAANVSSIVPSKTHVLLSGGVVSGRNVLRVNLTNPGSEFQRFPSLDNKATPDSGGKTVKPRSIVCSSCEGNGAVACSQCKGNGVNSVDHFNGQFKAGGLCWLCRGKRDILCGDCNGAGFIGGFMSTHDD